MVGEANNISRAWAWAVTVADDTCKMLSAIVRAQLNKNLMQTLVIDSSRVQFGHCNSSNDLSLGIHTTQSDDSRQWDCQR